MALLCIGVVGATAQTTGSDSSRSSSTGSDRTGTTGTGTGMSSGSTDSTSSSANTYGSSSRDSDSSSLKRSDKHFITKVAESSEKEVAIAQLAAEKATDPGVKSYAQQLIDDHQKMNSELMQLAQRKGVALENSKSSRHSMHGMTGSSTSSSGTGTADTSGSGSGSTSGTAADTGVASTNGGGMGSSMASGDNDATHDRHYRSLAKKSGKDFDKEFVEMMVDDHKKDVKMFQKEAKDADDAEIRTFAANHVATLQAHLDRANSLTKSAAE